MSLIKTIPLDELERKKVENTWNSNNVLKYIGVKVDMSDENMVRAIIDPIQTLHRGGLGTEAVNGAVLSSLFDLVIGLVGIVNSNKHRTGTIQLNINFLRPLSGNKVIIEGKLIKNGKSIVFARAEAYDEDHNLCSTCDGICSIDLNKPIVDNFMSI
ncbi:MAG: PaaI family thioesterase [Candidatus Sericytochromatia bacterium]|nr:PaaI family thioesterase [Candidatus Sericytochromatia bacterium]